MAKNNNDQTIPESKQALKRLKTQTASELGIQLREGYNGDLPARQAGSIGGHMVRKMIRYAEQNMR